MEWENETEARPVQQFRPAVAAAIVAWQRHLVVGKIRGNEIDTLLIKRGNASSTETWSVSRKLIPLNADVWWMTRLFWNLLALFMLHQNSNFGLAMWGQRGSAAQLLGRNRVGERVELQTRPALHSQTFPTLKRAPKGKIFSWYGKISLLISSKTPFQLFYFFIYLFFFTNTRAGRPTSGASNSCTYRPDIKDPPASHMAALIQPDSTPFSHSQKRNIWRKRFLLCHHSVWQHREVCVYRERDLERGSTKYVFLIWCFSIRGRERQIVYKAWFPACTFDLLFSRRKKSTQSFDSWSFELFVYAFRTKLQAVVILDSQSFVKPDIGLLPTGNVTMEQHFRTLEQMHRYLHEWLINKPMRNPAVGVLRLLCTIRSVSVWLVFNFCKSIINDCTHWTFKITNEVRFRNSCVKNRPPLDVIILLISLFLYLCSRTIRPVFCPNRLSLTALKFICCSLK